MKKKLFSLLSFVLAMLMISSALASCTGYNPDEETSGSNDSTQAESDPNNNGSSTEDGNDPGNHETEGEGGGEVEGPELPPALSELDNGRLIQYANNIKNGVNYYYPNYKRESAVIENMEMSLEYGLLESGKKQVIALKNKSGVSYVENTMDAFIRMTDGKTYYASSSNATTTSNLFRLGYYFYEARFEGQDFYNSAPITSKKNISLADGTGVMNDITLVSNENGEITFKITNDNSGAFDPYLTFADGSHTSKKDSPFTLIELTMKIDSGVRNAQLYINTGAGFNSQQRHVFSVIADGNYHTYTIPVYTIKGYNGRITGLRLDLDGKDGNVISINDMKLVAADIETAPVGLSIARSYNVYSDKMHHTLQVSAQTETTGIAAVGILTSIPEETVEKLIVKDASGTHNTISGIDWATVEYIAFDIKDAGIFGYILPYDNKNGTLNVALTDGVYKIEQTATPEGGTITPSVEGTNNANDFFMGQRIYTDANHDFAEFLAEAEIERNPISKTFIKVSETDSNEGSTYLGYDALRGLYTFEYKASMSGPNDYPNIKFSIKINEDRKIYVMAYSSSSSVVESTFLLDNRDMLLPVPIEVGKNFSENSGERNIYNIDDPVYSESIFPLVLESGKLYRYNIVNVYRKWGNFPLKQVSWIQFFAPYYHLSTGVTETNCIVPWYATRVSRDLGTLPDFRAMSAPAFSGDQKNSGGFHRFLRYTDSDGNYITSENTINTIGSFGPTYADVNMDYITDDGKIKITYNHMEMPQEDENRTYYEMNYEILEDVSFKDFAKDFSFYSVASNDPKGVYTLLGYLAEDDTSKVVDAKMAGDEAAYYVLGKNAPYFSYMKMTEDRGNGSGYINLAFLVHSTEFIIGGEKVEPNFLLTDLGGTLSISLNYGELTLKKGDKITINAILLPWGSQETIYDGSNGKAPDQNVRDVRQNSILNPLKATAKADCEVIDTVYVPMLKTTNGKTAEFTLSGGNDNCAVRIYGFSNLTAPELFELVDGEWIPYRTASAYYSYNHDLTHPYDGYGVYYDEDGTFSYTFVADMDNGAERTFKISTEKEFKVWGEIDPAEIKSNAVQNEYINLIVKGENLFNAAEGAVGFGKIEYLSEEGAVRFYSDPNKNASYFYVFQGNKFETGDYLVIKYRTSNHPTTFKLYTSTIQPGATYENHYWSSSTIVRDGNWHVLVIDISAYEANQEIKFNNEGRDFFDTFPTADDGKYYASFLRLDIYNQILTEDRYIDIQYIGFSNDLEKIKAYNQDVYELDVSGTGVDPFEKVLTGGNPPSVDPDPDPDPTPTPTPTPGNSGYISSDSSFKPSDNAYIAHIDSINNISSSINTNSTGDVKTINFTNEMIKGSKLNIAGWIMVENGVSKYVWSINGKDWFDCGILKNPSYGDCGTSIINAANNTLGKVYTFTSADATKGSFQANSALVIDLTDKFSGTVNVTVAAVTAENENELCIITQIKGVCFDGSNIVDPDGYTVDDKFFVFHVDKVNGKTQDENGKKYSYNSVSNKKLTNLELNESTVNSANAANPGTELIIGGWTVLQGGISKFLWSVDGKNWYDCKANLTSCSQTVLSAASGMMGGAYTYTTVDGTNGQYSIIIDLKDYAGQTVNVQIAAVPASGDGTTICVLSSINGVTVSGK